MKKIVGNPFSGEVFVPSLHQNTPQDESGSVRLYSSTLGQRSGWMTPKRESMGIGNDLRTNVE